MSDLDRTDGDRDHPDGPAVRTYSNVGTTHRVTRVNDGAIETACGREFRVYDRPKNHVFKKRLGHIRVKCGTCFRG